tara:strand:- start:28722 stop:28991 length:270 start_codon:yes stop_codon:yes gene_type:complete
MTTKSVIRGGGRGSTAARCRSAIRGRNSPSNRNDYLGFRVVKEKKIEYRVGRGGGWDCTADFCRSANRNWYSPSYRYYYLGFRVIKDMA